MMSKSAVLFLLVVSALAFTAEGCMRNPWGEGDGEEHSCEGDQVWNKCVRCNKTCDDPKPECDGECEPGCQCPFFKPIWHEGKCINKIQCPDTHGCEGGMKWESCARCNASCDNPLSRCKDDGSECEPGCACPFFKHIWHEDKCINILECPVPECEGGQKWTLCGSCDRTCAEPRPDCDVHCEARCQCPFFRPISHEGQCISSRDCPDSEEGDSPEDSVGDSQDGDNLDE